jgi:hypothetical protein
VVVDFDELDDTLKNRNGLVGERSKNKKIYFIFKVIAKLQLLILEQKYKNENWILPHACWNIFKRFALNRRERVREPWYAFNVQGRIGWVIYLWEKRREEKRREEKRREWNRD